MIRRTPPLEVMIVGAGITGLALGLVLHQKGVRVKVIDRQPLPEFVAPPEFDQRIYAMSLASEGFLRRAGGWQDMDRTRIQPILGMNVQGDRDGRLSLAPDGGQTSPMGWIVEAGTMLSALHRHQKRVAPELLETGVTVSAVHEKEGGLEVHLSHGQCWQTRLLVAADGLHSTLRERFGIPAYFSPYGHRAVVANYRIGGHHGGVARQWFVPGEVIALLPLPGQRVSLVWSAQSDHAQALLAMSPEQRAHALQQQVGYELGLLEEISVPADFELRRMNVARWIASRFALVGDAAHGVHPMAGQGLNLGLQDAACLADTLLERGPGPDCGDRSLLRRYERARREPVAVMQGLTGGLAHLFSASRSQWGWARNWGMNRLERCSWLKHELVRYANR
jgi:2-octaprenyl-6-methoxyphenol hydroxylase